MSTRLRRCVRVAIDDTIRRRLAWLAGNGVIRRRFLELVQVARARSTLLHPSAQRDACPVQALFALAHHHQAFTRSPWLWPAGEASHEASREANREANREASREANVYALVRSLAIHVVGRHDVPQVLSDVWFAEPDARGREAQRWFIAHSNGQRFRDVPGLPIALTRKMERLLLTSSPDLPLRQAIRRAELRALGAEAWMIGVILDALGDDLSRGEFWRPVFEWFVRHTDELDGDDVEQMIDYLVRLSLVPHVFRTPDGPVEIDPPEPEFSITGRSVAAMRRRMNEWWTYQPQPKRSRVRWRPLAIPAYASVVREDPERLVRWSIVELTNDAELQAEGYAMRHCVGAYVQDCLRGESSIWSLRRSEVTSEVQPEASSDPASGA